VKYYEGAISYTEIENSLTIPEILELNRSATRIEAENKKATEDAMRSGKRR